MPITAQTLGVMLAGSVLGARRGFLSQLLFLALVAIGLPVLPAAGGGLAVFAGPTAGLPDQLADRRVRHRAAHRAVLGPLQLAWGVLANVLGGILVIYAIGVPVLEAVDRSAVDDALWFGAAVFIPGDLVKAVIAAVSPSRCAAATR